LKGEACRSRKIKTSSTRGSCVRLVDSSPAEVIRREMSRFSKACSTVSRPWPMPWTLAVTRVTDEQPHAAGIAARFKYRKPERALLFALKGGVSA
jgi:hypothetical protein